MKAKPLRLLLVFFLIILIGVSACSQSNETGKNDIVNQKYVSRMGVLRSLGAKIGGESTHLIQENNDTITFVYSDIIDLNEPQYLNKKIRISGNLTPGKEGHKDEINVQEIEIMEIGEKKLTYEDKDFGLILEYSEALTLQKDQSRIIFNSALGAKQNIVIYVFNLPQDTTFETYLKDILGISEERRIPEMVGKEKITGYKVMGVNESLLDIYAMNENRIYNFSHLSQDESTFEPYREYFYQIVENVSFIGAAPKEEVDEQKIEPDIVEEESQPLPLQSGYTLFESSSLHFKIQYPSSWYFEGTSGTYYFSDKPIGENENLLTLEIAQGSEIPNEKIKKTEEEGKMLFVVRSNIEGRVYKIKTSKDNEKIAEIMAKSIED
ncbi:hypothetical protein HYV56_00985 [Candidatus Peregrinibacteria bacterium]|nr:hypothetical protein [Candidatus Peregrinibacteria bacterium]